MPKKIAILTSMYRVIVAIVTFSFCGPLGRQQEGNLDCMKSMHKNWNITASFITHEDFDHVWVEHYPTTLRGTYK